MASYRKRLNKWQARVHNQGIKAVTKSFGNHANAERWARQVESRLDAGSYAEHSEARRTTVTDLIERYWQDVTPQKKGAKQEGYLLNVLSRWSHAGRSVVQISSRDIACYRDGCRA